MFCLNRAACVDGRFGFFPDTSACAWWPGHQEAVAAFSGVACWPALCLLLFLLSSPCSCLRGDFLVACQRCFSSTRSPGGHGPALRCNREPQPRHPLLPRNLRLSRSVRSVLPLGSVPSWCLGTSSGEGEKEPHLDHRECLNI